MSETKRMNRAILLSAAITAAAGASAQAADTWDGGGANANWSTGNNWVDNTAPTQGVGDVITMGAAGALQLNNTVDQSFTIGQLNFANSAGYVVGSANGATLTISVASGTAQVSSSASTGNSTVNVNLFAPGLLTLSPAASTTLSITSNISATGLVDKAATAGTLILTGNNSFAGGFLFRGPAGATIGVGSNTALGQAGQLVTNDSGTAQMIYNTTGSALNIAANFALGNGNNNSGVLQFGANDATAKPDITLSGSITQLTGQIVNPSFPDGNRMDVRQNQTVVLAGTFTGAQTLTKIGQGTLALTANNAGLFTGSLEILNGTVRVGNDNALGSATVIGATNATVRLLSFDGNPRTLSNNFTLQSGGIMVLTETLSAANTTTSAMNLNGSLSLNGSYSLNVETNNVATVNGTISNGASVGSLSKGNPGTLILTAANTYTGGTTLAAGGFRVANDAAFGTGTFTNNSSAATTFLSAIGDRTFANNLVLGSNNTLQFGQAQFGANGNMTFTGTVSLVGLNANPDPLVTADDYKPLSVVSGVTVSMTNTISEVVAGSGITKAGPGTLVLTGINSFTGAINVTGSGAVVVNGTNVANAILGAGQLRGTGTVRLLGISDNTADSVANGGTLSPGDDTTAATFVASRAALDNGGRLLFNLTNASGTAGVGWDLLQLNGVGTPNANVDVGATASGFEVELASLDTNFNINTSQSFRIIEASGVTNFTPGDIFVDFSAFAPQLAGGSFSVAQNGTNLDLVYTPVPEPTALMGLALPAAWGLLRRRSRKARS